MPNGLFTRLDPYRRTGHYVMRTEVHVYAFSMAANILLSFFPFLIVMVSLCRHVLHWQAAEHAVFLAIGDFFPDSLGGFIRRNLSMAVDTRGPFQIGSILLLLFTANGVFEPLEVALNRAWGITRNRSFFRNQLVSLGLIFVCGGLALASAALTAYNQDLWREMGFGQNAFTMNMNLAIFKVAAVPLTIIALVLTYWLLPNGKVPVQRLVPVSIIVAVALEVLKYLNLVIWPLISDRLLREYGPFYYSVTIVLSGFLASMIVLAGAEWAARQPEPLDPTVAEPAD